MNIDRLKEIIPKSYERIWWILENIKSPDMRRGQDIHLLTVISTEIGLPLDEEWKREVAGIMGEREVCKVPSPGFEYIPPERMEWLDPPIPPVDSVPDGASIMATVGLLDGTPAVTESYHPWGDRLNPRKWVHTLPIGASGCVLKWAWQHRPEGRAFSTVEGIHGLLCACGREVSFDEASSKTAVKCPCGQQYMSMYEGATEYPVFFNAETDSWQSFKGELKRRET